MIQYGTFRSLPLGCFVQNPPSLFQSPSKSCFHCCGSVAKSCVDCSTSGFPILHYLQVCSDSHPLKRWCHPTISSSVALFTSCLQSFPGSGSFPMSQFFPSGGQSIGASASASVLPVNCDGLFPLGQLASSPCCPKDSQESSLESQFISVHFSRSVMSDCLWPHEL